MLARWPSRASTAHISDMSNPAPVRVHAGVPNGGQFAPGNHSEGPPFDTDDTSPVPITALGLADGETMYLTDFDLGDDVFETVEVHRDGDRYTASGTVPIDLYAEIGGGTDQAYAAHQAAEQLLTDREADIESFLTDQYGARLETGNTEWEEQAVAFTIQLDPAADTTGDILDRLHRETGGEALRRDLLDESDRGFYRSLQASLDGPLAPAPQSQEHPAAPREFNSDFESDEFPNAFGSASRS